MPLDPQLTAVQSIAEKFCIETLNIYAEIGVSVQRGTYSDKCQRAKGDLF